MKLTGNKRHQKGILYELLLDAYALSPLNKCKYRAEIVPEIIQYEMDIFHE